jgi:hypothetical protein
MARWGSIVTVVGAFVVCATLVARAAYPPFIAPRSPAFDAKGLASIRPPLKSAPAATQPGGSALEKLRALLHEPDLVLSTGPRSAAEHFGVSVRFRHRAKRKDWVWDAHAVRDGDRVVAAVYSGPDGKTAPVVVMADGLFVAVDPMFPGRLLVGTDAQPSLRLSSQGKGFNYSLTWERKPELLFDSASILESVLAEAKSSNPSPDGEAVLVETERYRVAVLPRPADSHLACRVQALEFAQGYRRLQAWVVERSAAESFAALSPLTAGSVKALGLEQRAPSAEDVQLLLTPGLFDVDAHSEYAAVTAKLRSLPRRSGYHFPPPDSSR